MIELLVLAAAPAVQPVRLAPIVVPQPVRQAAPVTTTTAPPTAPVTTTTVPPTAPTTDAVSRADPSVAHLLPDLVVKGVRIAGSRVYVLVANEGTGPAKAFSVKADLEIGRGRAESFMTGGIGGLAVGESNWADIGGFVTVKFTDAPPEALDWSKVTAVHANADPRSHIWFAPPSDPFNRTRSPCTEEAGCVKELSEDNNEIRVEGDAIGRGKPE